MLMTSSTAQGRVPH